MKLYSELYRPMTETDYEDFVRLQVVREPISIDQTQTLE